MCCSVTSCTISRKTRGGSVSDSTESPAKPWACRLPFSLGRTGRQIAELLARFLGALDCKCRAVQEREARVALSHGTTPGPSRMLYGILDIVEGLSHAHTARLVHNPIPKVATHQAASDES